MKDRIAVLKRHPQVTKDTDRLDDAAPSQRALVTGLVTVSHSQAARKAILYPGRQSGQCLIKEILDRLDRTLQHHLHYELSISWILGHQDINGNERAGQAAKHAARNPPNTLTKSVPSYLPLKSSLKQQIHTTTTTASSDYWQTETTTATHLRLVTQDAKVTSGQLYHAVGSRFTSAKLAQHRTGHCGLNAYLHRFNIVETPAANVAKEKRRLNTYYWYAKSI